MLGASLVNIAYTQDTSGDPISTPGQQPGERRWTEASLVNIAHTQDTSGDPISIPCQQLGEGSWTGDRRGHGSAGGKSGQHSAQPGHGPAV